MEDPHVHSNTVISPGRFSTSTLWSPTAPHAQTQSMNTLRMSPSSRTFEPLLRSDGSVSVERTRDNAPAQDATLNLLGDSLTAQEEEGRLLASVKKRLMYLRVAKGMLEVAIGVCRLCIVLACNLIAIIVSSQALGRHTPLFDTLCPTLGSCQMQHL
jgi:hypothetical protein